MLTRRRLEMLRRSGWHTGEPLSRRRHAREREGGSASRAGRREGQTTRRREGHAGERRHARTGERRHSSTTRGCYEKENPLAQESLLRRSSLPLLSLFCCAGYTAHSDWGKGERGKGEVVTYAAYQDHQNRPAAGARQASQGTGEVASRRGS